MPSPALVSGNSAASSPAMRDRSADAFSAVTPGRIRPTAQNAAPSRVSQAGLGAVVNGSHTSVGPNGSWYSAPSTPITCCGTPFSTSVRPTSPESAPKREVQIAWERTATRAAVPTLASSSVKTRPSWARAPRRRKTLALTKAPESRSGRSLPVMFTLWPRMMLRSSSVRLRVRYSTRSG